MATNQTPNPPPWKFELIKTQWLELAKMWNSLGVSAIIGSLASAWAQNLSLSWVLAICIPLCIYFGILFREIAFEFGSQPEG